MLSPQALRRLTPSGLPLDLLSRSAARLPYFVELMKPRVMVLAIFTALIGMITAPARLDPLPAVVAVLSITAGLAPPACSICGRQAGKADVVGLTNSKCRLAKALNRAPPTIVHAVLDALAPFGIDHFDVPLTSHKV